MYKKKEKSAEVADFFRSMWSSLHISIAGHFDSAAVLQKIPLKALFKSKVFDHIYFISDVEFLVAAAARINKEMQFHLSETLFLTVMVATVYRYTDSFGVLAETSKCVAVIVFSPNS